jgi:cyclic beta-1,2-glucan synthetase
VPVAPQVVSLSRGQYTIRLSDAGSGYSQCRGAALCRWFPDETRDADGFYIYLRDLDDAGVWSAGYQPTRVPASRYDFHYAGGVAEIRRVDGDIACALEVCVSPGGDFEIRRCRLTNLGDRTRRIEVTSYLEWVLGSAEADASHPAFSKLFVETQYCGQRQAILARRRPRHADDQEFWGFHAIVGDAAETLDGVTFETNRLRFIGRGRTLARPLALEPGVALSGETGPVLDPIASLRSRVSLEPGARREVAFVLGGARSRAEIDELLATLGACGDAKRLLGDGGADADSAGNGWAPAEGPASAARRVIVHRPHRLPGRERLDLPDLPTVRESAPATEIGGEGAASMLPPGEALQFDNGYGGFSADGREYIIRLEPDGRGGQRRPPAPWVNVIANEQAGCLVSECGAGYTWSGNSRENRLTAWHNDPVIDPHSEALWIRDEESGVFWSPMPGPAPAAAGYRVRHGFGYTIFEHESHGLSQEVSVFMAAHEPVKLTRLRLVNRSRQVRRLSLFSYVHWALAAKAGHSASAVTTTYDAEQGAIWAANPHRECYGAHTAFSAIRTTGQPQGAGISYSGDRGSFLGRYGDSDAPAAVAGGAALDGRTGNGLDPCAAWQVPIELSPGETFECTSLLGEVAEREMATELIDQYSDAADVERALAEVKQFWCDTLGAIRIETPNREIDLVINGWLVYQNISCRMWGRSAYYQPGGAYGFRDQLQDSAALLFHRPDLTRAQILRHAAQQFVEGDVLHWWHPDLGCGLRTRFSDDLLWLPFVATEYVEKTGDSALWDEEAPFITAPPLAEGQQEAFLRPARSDEQATLYEHCCRALDRGLTRGAHGLPLIGCGDWNDGFSRVGRLGRGESVWLGMFIDYVLERMLRVCVQRGDTGRSARYAAYRGQLREALQSAAWDGAWYRRAYYDNGQPIGSAHSDECQIDALAQAWAIISGIATPERAQMALEAVESRLIDDEAGMIRLLTPPFDRTPNDPGYIKGYVRGIRENGGQYTHGVLWMVRAMAEMGRGTRAVELLRMLSPVWHTSSTERADIYKTEPYVVAADVYGEPPHVGRGGWTWYTGSAGWMFRVTVESIFGLSIEAGRTLVVNPSISAAWPQCRLTYRLPDGRTRYEITIENPTGRERGVREATVDGEPAVVENSIARVPLERDGQLHRVVVRL